MDELERRRILSQARATLQRLNGNGAAPIEPRGPSYDMRTSAPLAQPEPDPVAKWKRDADAREAAFAAERAKDAAASDMRQADVLRAWLDGELSRAMQGVGKAIGELLADEAVEIGAELAKRDRKIEALELQLAKLAADVAKANLRLAEVDADRGRRAFDWSATPAGRAN